MRQFAKLILVMFFSIVVAACGGGGGSGGGSTTAAINATATTTAQSLTVGTAIASFSPLTPSGGATPYTYSYTGTLPTGLSFSASTGAVTGTSTATYATTSLVFSVKDANNVVASTTSTVSFTVAAWSGVTFSGTVAGFNSVANTHYSNGVYVAGGLTGAYTTGQNYSYSWIAANGALAILVYDQTRDILFLILPSQYQEAVHCGVSSVVVTGLMTYPLCSSFSITFDRAAGVIAFASTPLFSYAGLYVGVYSPIGITATGSLSFAPF